MRNPDRHPLSVEIEFSPPEPPDASLNDHRGATLVETSVDLQIASTLPRDKWLLASLLQKSIRRGDATYASAAADVLTTIDVTYLARRLPVIAYEDVGIANFPLVDAVRHASRDLTNGDASARAARIACTLAGSVKSRTACDILSLCSFSPEVNSLERGLARKRVPGLIKTIADSEVTVLERAVALRRLMGVRTDGCPPLALGRDERAVAMAEVFRVLKLPPIAAEVVLRGGQTQGLNTAIPLAFALLDASGMVAIESRHQGELGDAKVNGLPAYVADMYTRPGQAAFRALLRSSLELRSLLDRYVAPRDQVRCLGFLVFHVEGSLMDRWLSFPAANEILAETEAVECRHVGIVDLWAARTIKEWLRTHLPLLNIARAEALTRAASSVPIPFTA